MVFDGLGVELQGPGLLVLPLEGFTGFEAPPLEDVFGGEGHGVDPVTVLLQLSQVGAVGVEAADPLVFAATDDLASSTPEHLGH